jgi:hypothetical protein
MSVIEQCRYCGRQGGDEFSFGPDDPAPGVCPTCLDARMADVMRSAAERAAHEPTFQLKSWLHKELVLLGLTPTWAQRFVDGQFTAFASARKRVSRR